MAIGVALLLCAAGLFAAAPSAHAQDGPSSPGGEGGEGPAATPERQTPREAVELFQRARNHYQNGRYAEAAHDLENALVLDPGSPTLLFNLGRVYELSGEHADAIRIYGLYLRVIPESDAAERERTEAAVRRLQGAATYERPDEDAYSEPIYVSQRGVADDAFWITLGAGGAITVAGAVLAITAAVLNDQAGGFVLGWAGELADRQGRYDTASAVALTADIVGATGGATLLAAALLWLLRERTVELYPAGQQPIVSIGPWHDGVSLSLGASF